MSSLQQHTFFVWNNVKWIVHDNENMHEESKWGTFWLMVIYFRYNKIIIFIKRLRKNVKVRDRSFWNIFK